MTTSADQRDPKMGGPSHGKGPEAHFDEFVSFISKICADKSFQNLKAVVSNHDTLQKELSDTRTAYGKNLEELTRLTANWNTEKEKLEKKIEEQSKQYQKVHEDKVTACRKHKAEQDAVAGLNAKVKSLEEDVKRSINDSKKHEARTAKLESVISEREIQLAKVKEEVVTLKGKVNSTNEQLAAQSDVLKQTQDSLAMFRSHTAVLTPLEDDRMNISEMFGSWFRDASDLFRTFLCHDLEIARLQDSKSWDRVRDHAAIGRAIPLPASNSAHAKRMRAVAGLTIFAKALTSYLFQPTYLFADTGAEAVLDTLAEANPLQYALVRAVLLEVLPDKQSKRRDACAKCVVEEVSEAVACFVPEDHFTPFKSRLARLISVLGDNWQRVQRLDERVEPCFAVKTPEDWQPLPTWTGPVPPDNDTRAAATTRQANGERQKKQPESGPATLSTSNIAKVVWPAFLVTGLEQSADGEELSSDLVHQGYALTRADVQDAADEEKSRRAIRRATRDSNGTAQRKRRDSTAFLSHVLPAG